MSEKSLLSGVTGRSIHASGNWQMAHILTDIFLRISNSQLAKTYSLSAIYQLSYSTTYKGPFSLLGWGQAYSDCSGK